MCFYEIIGVCILIFMYVVNFSVLCLELIYVVVLCFYSWLIKLVFFYLCSNLLVLILLI